MRHGAYAAHIGACVPEDVTDPKLSQHITSPLVNPATPPDTSLRHDLRIAGFSLNGYHIDITAVDAEFDRNTEAAAYDTTDIACREIAAVADIAAVFAPCDNRTLFGLQRTAAGDTADMDRYLAALAGQYALRLDISEIAATQNRKTVGSDKASHRHVLLGVVGLV